MNTDLILIEKPKTNKHDIGGGDAILRHAHAISYGVGVVSIWNHLFADQFRSQYPRSRNRAHRSHLHKTRL